MSSHCRTSQECQKLCARWRVSVGQWASLRGCVSVCLCVTWFYPEGFFLGKTIIRPLHHCLSSSSVWYYNSWVSLHECLMSPLQQMCHTPGPLSCSLLCECMVVCVVLGGVPIKGKNNRHPFISENTHPSAEAQNTKAHPDGLWYYYSVASIAFV